MAPISGDGHLLSIEVAGLASAQLLFAILMMITRHMRHLIPCYPGAGASFRAVMDSDGFISHLAAFHTASPFLLISRFYNRCVFTCL